METIRKRRLRAYHVSYFAAHFWMLDAESMPDVIDAKKMPHYDRPLPLRKPHSLCELVWQLVDHMTTPFSEARGAQVRARVEHGRILANKDV
jgi:hypothetical protein